MTTRQTKLESAWQVVNLSAFSVGIATATIALCAGIAWGKTLGLVLLVTAAALLVLGLPFKANTKTLVGVILAVIGYALGLPGYFKPVEIVAIEVPSGYEVKIDSKDCTYSPKTASLRCKATLSPAK
ncbi:hypothetical protein ACYPKM_04330 [Pseudomonas aeruginosa]